MERRRKAVDYEYMATVACLCAIAIWAICEAAFNIMLPYHEKSFTHVVRPGDTVWSIADQYFPNKTSLKFIEFETEIEHQVKEQYGDVNLKPGQRIKVVWQDKY